MLREVRCGPSRLILLGNDDTQDTVVKMLVEVLRGGEAFLTDRTLSIGSPRGIVTMDVVSRWTANEELSAVWWRLFHVMDGCQVSFKDISAVESLLISSPKIRAEGACHAPLVMCQSMAVLVVFPCEPFDVVLASFNGTFLRALLLMGEHMCCQVFEDTTAVWMGAAITMVAGCGSRAGALLTGRPHIGSR